MKRLIVVFAGVAVVGLALGGARGAPSARAADCSPDPVTGQCEPTTSGSVGTPPPGFTCCDKDGGGGSPVLTESRAVDSIDGVSSCWYQTWSLYRGTWPQNHDTFLHTTWCGTGPHGRITYRSSNTTTATYFCSTQSTYATRVSGGVGYSQVTVEGGAYFACPSGVPWLQLHYHNWMQIRYYPGGGSTAIDWG